MQFSGRTVLLGGAAFRETSSRVSGWVAMPRAFFATFMSALLLSGCISVSPTATGQSLPPPPPPRISDHVSSAEIQRNVEQRVGEILGTEAVRQAQEASTSIMASSYQGRFDAGGPRVNVAVRGSANWLTWKSGRPTPLAAIAAKELDRLLGEPALWREAPFYPDMDCPDAGATMMVIRHRGRTVVTRQGCNPAGLLGRLEEAVLNERL